MREDDMQSRAMAVAEQAAKRQRSDHCVHGQQASTHHLSFPQDDMQSGAMAVAQQAAKRQRLNHAAQLEDERTGRTRALAAKVGRVRTPGSLACFVRACGGA